VEAVRLLVIHLSIMMDFVAELYIALNLWPKIVRSVTVVMGATYTKFDFLLSEFTCVQVTDGQMACSV